MSLTKANLKNSLYEKSDFQKQASMSAVESLLEIIKHTLESGEDVMISGFGKFSFIEKNARRGRNPHTGESLMIAPRKIATFKASPRLRVKVDG